jgi:hypothetical protein
MNRNNLYGYANCSLESSDTILHVSEYSFFLMILSINFEDKKINLFSDELLYLINNYYKDGWVYYESYADIYNNNILSINDINNIAEFYDVNALQLMTSFSRGSVHGFSGFYSILTSYLSDREKYSDFYLIVYKNSQKGIFDIINHLCEIGSLDGSKIIYIDKDKFYKFKKIHYIINDYHMIKGNLLPRIDFFKDKYILPYIKPSNTNAVCIIKTNTTANVSHDGIFENYEVNTFCEKYNLEKISDLNELELINKINNCEIFVVSYGSAFYKNFSYISEKCKRVIAIINGGAYTENYNLMLNIKQLYTKYKNADFIYKITESLDFCPYDNII